VDRFCKKINDGRIDYSVLYTLWMSQYEESSVGAGELAHTAYAADDVWKPAQQVSSGPGEALTTPEVQQLYTQWTLGKLDAHTLIERLNLIPEILGIGGVSPSCTRRILDHQFDHDLLYSDFLRALRNTGPPEFVPDRLDMASLKKSKKKIFENPPGQLSESKELLFPSQATMDAWHSQPVMSVVSGKEMRGLSTKAAVCASDGVANALTSSDLLADGMTTTWTPSRGEKVVGADSAVMSIGDAGDTQGAQVRERKHFRAQDQVGHLLGPQDPASIPPNRPHKKPGLLHKEGAGVGAVLFGGGNSVADSLGGDGARPGVAGVSSDGSRPIGKRTYHAGMPGYNVAGDNHDIAIGSRVNESSAQTTQELLWGNMIRRAR